MGMRERRIGLLLRPQPLHLLQRHPRRRLLLLLATQMSEISGRDSRWRPLTLVQDRILLIPPLGLTVRMRFSMMLNRSAMSLESSLQCRNMFITL